MQYWLMKSEPDVWSIDQQKNNDDMKIYCNNYLKIVKNLINEN